MNKTHFSETEHNTFSRRRKGFTLVEILAATGIMVVIILLVLTLTTNVLSSWTRSSGQLQTNFEARVALDLLTSDIESMVIRNRPICWLQVSYHNVGDATESPILFFFAPTLERPRYKRASEGANREDILGDVCAISYRLDYDNPFIDGAGAGSEPMPVYGLYRSVVDAENTFNHALSITDFVGEDDDGNTTYGATGSTLADYWSGQGTDDAGNPIDKTVVGESGLPDTIDTWTLDAGNFLSQNVANFEVVFYYRNASGTLESITPPEEFVYADQLYLKSGSDWSPEPGAQLEYVDVTLTILSSEGAELLNAFKKNPTAGGGVDYNTAISQYGQVFTRRINIMSGGG